jgi:hypothetical protein
MKLNLGCGTKKLDGWINVDCVSKFKPDLLHDIGRSLPYEDERVDEILAEDILEHFDKYQRFIIFYDWARVLKCGGTITIRVPNMRKILARYFHVRLKFNYDSFFNRIFGENIWESERYIGNLGIHKWGYTEKSLKKFIGIFGLKPVKVIKKESDLIIISKKYKHVNKEEIEKIIIYPLGKKSGRGISVEDVKNKITEFQASANKAFS